MLLIYFRINHGLNFLELDTSLDNLRTCIYSLGMDCLHLLQALNVLPGKVHSGEIHVCVVVFLEASSVLFSGLTVCGMIVTLGHVCVVAAVVPGLFIFLLEINITSVSKCFWFLSLCCLEF